MRKIRIFDKATKQPINLEMPYGCIGLDGGFYMYSMENHKYLNITDNVIMNDSTDVFDDYKKEIFVDDIVEVDVDSSYNSYFKSYGTVHYDPFGMSYGINFINTPPILHPHARFYIRKVLGNIHQNDNLMNNLKMKYEKRP